MENLVCQIWVVSGWFGKFGRSINRFSWKQECKFKIQMIKICCGRRTDELPKVFRDVLADLKGVFVPSNKLLVRSWCECSEHKKEKIGQSL